MKSVATTTELKGLQTQLAQATAKRELLQQEVFNTQKEVHTLTTRIKSLNNRIKQLKENEHEPVVSEHAILRYLERVKGVDLDALKHEIMDDKTVENIKFLKSGKIKRAEYDMVIQDNVVVSIY